MLCFVGQNLLQCYLISTIGEIDSYQNDVDILQGGLQSLLQSIKEQDADRVSVNLQSTLDTVAELELLQVLQTR